MKTTFLQKLAKEIHETHPDKLDTLCFVFPSKRSGLFFKKELAKLYKTTFWAPEILTIETFVSQLSGLNLIGPLEQIFELFEVHRELNIQPQLPFEKFIDHGKLILADFNDIEMSLTDASQLFENVKAYIDISEWDPSDPKKGELIGKYFSSFDNLTLYYSALNKRLLEQGKAYQGLAYRYLNTQVKSKNITDLNAALNKYSKVYVAGLNALTPAEIWLFDYLKESKKLHVYYEAEAQMIDDSDQESGYFLRKFFNTEEGDFKWKEDLLTNSTKAIDTYAVNGSLAMARMVGELFTTKPQLSDGNETAIILADESLLLPVLESLPKSIGEVNVTLGFPLGLTPFMSLAEQLFSLQNMARRNESSSQFYFKDVLKVLTNPVIVSLVTNSKPLETVINTINANNQIWIPESFISQFINENPELKFIEGAFENWKTNPELAITFLNEIIFQYQKKMELQKFADDVLTEQLYFFKTVLGQLENYINKFSFGLSLDAIRKLFKQIVSPLQVPFSGEPLAGIQIMGLLETRLLSFKNVVFVSVNEGVIPSKGGNQSFLPYTLRNHFGIQTHNHRDSLFAYHFYRILSQAENINLIYDTSSMGVGSNEKSRFIRQIEQEWPEYSDNINFEEFVGVFDDEKTKSSTSIEKTPDVIRNIENYLTQRGLSPSAFNNYLESPYDFYYKNVLGIQEPNSVDEDVEHNTFGTIVHACLEEFYKPFLNCILTSDLLRSNLSNLDSIIKTEFTKEIPYYKRGKQYMSFYSVSNYVKRFIHQDIDFLKSSSETIVLKGNEQYLRASIVVNNLNVIVKGVADRVEDRDGVTYILDYKTGSVKAADLSTASMDELEEKIKPKANQVLMYAWMAHKQLNAQKVVSGIYSLRETKMNLLSAKIGEEFVLRLNHFEEVEGFITHVIQEMLNGDVPLKRNAEYQFAMF